MTGPSYDITYIQIKFHEGNSWLRMVKFIWSSSKSLHILYDYAMLSGEQLMCAISILRPLCIQWHLKENKWLSGVALHYSVRIKGPFGFWISEIQNVYLFLRCEGSDTMMIRTISCTKYAHDLSIIIIFILCTTRWTLLHIYHVQIAPASSEQSYIEHVRKHWRQYYDLYHRVIIESVYTVNNTIIYTPGSLGNV